MPTHVQIAVDCADAESLARFWEGALGYRMAGVPGGFATWAESSAADATRPGEEWRLLVDPAGARPPLLFHTVPEDKVTKNRIHIDLFIDTPAADDDGRKRAVDAEVTRLVELGASHVRTEDSKDGEYFVVLMDPEENEFCVA